MTSELLILTPSAVALAADSAVTIGDKKTYNGVNKLFMLSNNPPIGIMTYNIANFLNIPLETIIKEFRNNLSPNINSLYDLSEEFNHFLEEVVKDSVNKESFDEKLKYFIEILKIESEKFNIDEFKRIVALDVDNFNESELGEHHEQICSKLEEQEELFDVFIQEIEDEDEKNEFLSNLKKFFINKIFLDPFIGIVIAGFDNKKLFPSFIHFKINYLYGNNFILNIIDEDEIGKTRVILKPFAQGDVINTFLSSIDIETKCAIVKYFATVQQNYINDIKEAIKENNKINGKDEIQVLNEISKIELQNENLVESFSDFIESLKKEHSQPIIDSIAYLPKEELSNLAESLIKITSLKIKVQKDLETVGGPVDVAIITKGDGFVWTKRKHYFDASLNPQFFNRKKLKHNN